MNSFTIGGQIVDLVNSRIFSGVVVVENGKIIKIEEQSVGNTQYIMPGFVDAHVHIESSMLVPSEFARLATCHGTVATVSDPHEIANVLGKEGVRYMIDNGKKVPFKFFFGAPSCVPSTSFETAGFTLDANDIEELMASPDIYYLSEMMNYPGVIHDDPTASPSTDTRPQSLVLTFKNTWERASPPTMSASVWRAPWRKSVSA